MLPVVLPFIRSSNGVSLEIYLHGETCDEKGPCDSQFPVKISRVCAFVREGNDVGRAYRIAVFLNLDGGIANTVAEVVTTDRKSSGLSHRAK